MSRPRIMRIHWWRAKNCWSVVFSDHCEHFRQLVIRVPVVGLLQDKSPRAYLRVESGRLTRSGDNGIIE